MGVENLSITTTSSEETMNVAETLATYLKPGDLLTLEGDLGAGKTTFTKGLAKGLGVKRTVNSPTFTIIKEYRGKYPLYHMDVYRLEDSEEDLGFDEYFYGEGITVVEWAHFIKDYLPDELLSIEIKYKNETDRNIILTPYGDRYNQLCKEFNKNESVSN